MRVLQVLVLVAVVGSTSITAAERQTWFGTAKQRPAVTWVAVPEGVDVRRSFSVDLATGRSFGEVIWRRELPRVWGCVAPNGMLYGKSKDDIVALNTGDGAVMWRLPDHKGSIVVARSDGLLTVAADGTLRWVELSDGSSDVVGMLGRSWCSSEDAVVCGDVFVYRVWSTHTLAGYDLVRKKELWSNKVRGVCASAQWRDKVVVAGWLELLVIEPRTGEVVYRHQFSDGVESCPGSSRSTDGHACRMGLTTDGQCLIRTDRGRLVRVDIVNKRTAHIGLGHGRWMTGWSILGNRVFLTHTHGEGDFAAHSILDGHAVWKLCPGNEDLRCSMNHDMIATKTALFATSDTKLFSFAAEDGHLQSRCDVEGGGIHSIGVLVDRIIVFAQQFVPAVRLLD